MPRLFHVSETAAIQRFEPRPGRQPESLVWAITDERLHNYLLPRDCPRVTFYALETTTVVEQRQFLGQATNVVAIENRWEARVRTTALSIYEFSDHDFELRDKVAGYYTTSLAQTPLTEVRIDNGFDALTQRDVQVRVLDNLWRLRETVADSTLGFSIIRFRNAGPAPAGFKSRFS